MEPTNLSITAHYIVRARQRGYRREDLAIIEQLAALRADGLLLREKDVAAEIERLNMRRRRIRRGRANGNFGASEIDGEEYEIARKIDRLRRLQGSFIPMECGRAVSIYRPCRRRMKYVLRGGRRPRRDRRYWR